MEKIKNVRDDYDRKWNTLVAQDNKAKKAGVLVGRIVRHSYADGYAVYEIVKAGARTVTVQVVTGIGDDWVLPAWGRKATVGLNVVNRLLRYEDMLADLFS